MPSTRPDLGTWGDGNFYNNLFPPSNVDPTPFWNSPGLITFTKREALVDRGEMFRVSVRINYTDASGATPVFTNLSVLTSPYKGQPLHSHEVLIDRSTVNSISCRVNHSGSEFIISNIQVLAQQEKQRPRG